MATNHDHRPPASVESDHLRRTESRTLPKRVLPRTEVPYYLEGTPLQEQDRHAKSFHTNQPQAMQSGHRDAFRRPSLKDNLDLIERNLNRGEGRWFDMRWRKDDTGDTVEAGDGTPWNLHPQE